jgi:RNA polymerase sigma factor (sigma-70 family)
MSTSSRNNLLTYLHAVVGSWRKDSRDDAELLTRFTQMRDEQAFTTLVWRYSALVWRTCRSVLGEGPDTEDAFQTTFLLLARKANQLRSTTLPGWLYKVARRTALNTRTVVCRRQDLERRLEAMPRSATDGDAAKDELYAALQEELASLPERQRVPLVLRYLEGKTLEEVARILGCARTTLVRRLAKGEETLRARLSRRGLTVATASLGALLAETAHAAVPARLLGKVVQAALASTPEGSKLLSLTVAVAASLLVGLGLIAAPWQAPTAKPDASSGRDEPSVVRKDAPAGQPNRADIRGRVLSPDGRPVPNAQVTALAHRLFMPGEQTLHDRALAVAKTDAAGHFRLTVATDFPTWYPERRIALVVNAPGQAIHTVQLPLPNGDIRGHDPETVEVRLSRTSTIRGRLIDLKGKPAQGVPLRVARLGSAAFDPIAAGRSNDELLGWPGQVTTDADGRFELTRIGQTQMVMLRVEDERFAPHVLQLKPGETEVSAELEPARWIQGRVLAEGANQPLVNVRLSVYAPVQQGPVVHTVADDQIARIRSMDTFDTRTDAEGRFRVRVFPKRPYTVEFHPPGGSSYLAIRRMETPRTLGLSGDFILPRGVVVQGRLIEEGTATPVAGGSLLWDAPAAVTEPQFNPSVIIRAFGMTRADETGQFTLTVPRGPVRFVAFGPTQEYIARPCSFWGHSFKEKRPYWYLTPPPLDLTSGYCHAETFLERPPAQGAAHVTLSMRKGRTIRGEVVGADGQPVPRAVLLCSGRVSPMLNIQAQPLVVEHGRFLLPGCEEGRVYTVLVVDTKRGQGAVAQVHCPGAPDHSPRIRLEPCGTARVRVETNDNLPPLSSPYLFPPLRGFRDQFPSLYVRLPKSNLIGKPPRGPVPADLIEDYGIDPIYMHDNRRLGPDGEVTLPCLIPGAEYILAWQFQRGGYSPSHSRVFQVKPGEDRTLPTIVPGLPRDDR